MKRLNAVLRNPMAAYLISSYVFFPLFLLRYLDFQDRTVFRDTGFSELPVLILLSPYEVDNLGVAFLKAPMDGSVLHTVLYWLSFGILFSACWVAVSVLARKHRSC